ncbi:hypothetical protein PVL29_020110 [Vitis rotundifolia]|uniref:Uncharacterized protein n=1 Tax=Vitis rotundifolia TaxID=103349 RepID=A0AA38Z2A4_VITRO|nr:hypothetical protein PVL29_020110 [Vitis rotundifolia]
MWTASSISWRSFSVIPISNFPQTVVVHSNQRRHLLAASAQPQDDASSSAGDTTFFKSNLDLKEIGDGRQLSGSDVLWALQRAAAQKKKRISGSGNKKKNREPSSVGGNRGGSAEDSLDYSNVKPLCIKGDWGSKLDELERRLQELSDT